MRRNENWRMWRLSLAKLTSHVNAIMGKASWAVNNRSLGVTLKIHRPSDGALHRKMGGRAWQYRYCRRRNIFFFIDLIFNLDFQRQVIQDIFSQWIQIGINRCRRGKRIRGGGAQNNLPSQCAFKFNQFQWIQWLVLIPCSHAGWWRRWVTLVNTKLAKALGTQVSARFWPWTAAFCMPSPSTKQCNPATALGMPQTSECVVGQILSVCCMLAFFPVYSYLCILLHFMCLAQSGTGQPYLWCLTCRPELHLFSFQNWIISFSMYSNHH